MNIDADFDGVEETLSRFEELKEQWDGDGITFVTGTAVEYGVYLERGTEHMQPYPWFKPAIREYKADPEGFILDNTGWNTIDEIPNTEQLVTAVANALENKMSDNVNAQDPSGDRSPGTHPDHPSRDLGNLTASIQAVRIS